MLMNGDAPGAPAGRPAAPEYHYVECDCTTPEHVLRFIVDPSEPFPVYASVFLAEQGWGIRGFFRRCWLALKYVFGSKCRYGHFQEILIGRQQAEQLRELCDHALSLYEQEEG